MRYRTTKLRLELQVEEKDVEEVVLAIYSLVVPRHTKKLYFIAESNQAFQKLIALAKQEQGFSMIRLEDWPVRLNNRFRVSQDGAILYVVPGDNDKVTEDDLEQIALGMPDF